MQLVFEGAQANASSSEAATWANLQLEHRKAGVEAGFLGVRGELEALRLAASTLQEQTSASAEANCHCVHLGELAVRVQDFERELAAAVATKHATGVSAGPGVAAGVPDPWLPSQAEPGRIRKSRRLPAWHLELEEEQGALEEATEEETSLSTS